MKPVSYFLAFVVLACVMHKGNALKCYSHTCTNISATVPAASMSNCTTKMEITCKPMYSQQVDPDRCSTVRTEVSQGNMNRTTLQSGCGYSFMCPTLCSSVPSNAKCDAKCCEGDLCNDGKPRPSGPPPTKPTGPVGKDLTCYECGSTQGSPAASKCENPVKRTCGNDMMGKPQSMCMIMTMKIRSPEGKLVDSEMRNCSSPMRCNQQLICGQMSQLMNATDCKVTCCQGNLCNGDAKPSGPSGPSGDSIKMAASAMMVFMLSFGLIARF